ncbi:uncharacterized protein B0I36DRAFT_248220 [Microdochium trichocladiopsis]|uniref:Uncharacterized protein n=1 Tax=Microdochium trichocladiopsis TaxID=1682393 RepID=A0A9P9BMG3_9PEZI|nr:uncharacterized protein B0I36DRAFT_248220 [Microdochium trichocladiopsis]KAH7026248.1 hypothetical protein B0I36DRAFT_248220 [Microdochium trichocladiopsis]
MDAFAETTDVGDSEADVPSRDKRREATVYDAVAGTVTSTHALEDSQRQPSRRPAKRARHQAQRQSRLRSGQTSRNAVLAPEEVLFRRANAPTRYAERDIYFANERLPDGGRDILPDSDMLKALHVYASHFYTEKYGSRTPRHRKAPLDECSMDETAMLAFGIILEEASRELLGSSGDLVFTEGMELSEALD